MDKLYHVSKTPNLKLLIPHSSTHGEAYVYATKFPNLALLFGSRKSNGDLDGSHGLTPDFIPYFHEAYEGAFRRVFEGETSYIYEVDPTTFEENKTDFIGEVVSKEPVKVLACTKIENLYEYLINLAKNGKLELVTYSEEPNYQKYIKNHIKNRIIMFGVLKDKNSNLYRFCKDKFKDILEEVEETTNL